MASSLGKMPTTSVRRLISPLSRSMGIVGVQLGAVFLGEGHVCQHVMLSLIHDVGELGRLGADLIGNGVPLGAGRLRRLLGEGGGDEGTGDPAAALACMGKNITHEVHPAPLPGSAQYLGYRGPDAFMGV